MPLIERAFGFMKMLVRFEAATRAAAFAVMENIFSVISTVSRLLIEPRDSSSSLACKSCYGAFDILTFFVVSAKLFFSFFVIAVAFCFCCECSVPYYMIGCTAEGSSLRICSRKGFNGPDAVQVYPR